MPQKLTQATINKLINGFITEAGELTFPDEATIDEVNCVLNRDGSRQRRKGLARLNGGSALGFTSSSTVYNYYVWKNAGGTSGLDLLVLQLGSTLRFYDLSEQPLNTGLKSFTVDLSSYLAPTKTEVSSASFTNIFGGLIVATGDTETLYIDYTFATDSLTVTPIVFRVRDFEWQSSYDQLDRSIAVSEITSQRLYDTYNTGWIGPNGGSAALNTYIGTNTALFKGGLGGLEGSGYPSSTPPTIGKFYPPLTHPWFSNRDVNGNFNLTGWFNLQVTSSITANGLFKLDFFNQDRATASGIADIPTKVETSRFSTVATFGGRVWYSGLGSGNQAGKVLFSQVVTNVSSANALTVLGQCLQINDPTSETFSDILDTDGGVIDIPEAVGIKKLHAYNSSLFVFASNGVWAISGIDDKFSPTSYTINKVSSLGIDSPLSFVSAEGIPFWWSNTSINTVSFDETSGFPVVQDLSISTIQSFFDEIGEVERSQVFGDYDSFNKKIFWWYPEDSTYPARKNKVLILDIPLKAFYPWAVAGNSTKYALGSFYKDPSSSVTFQDEVTDNSLAVVTSGGESVVVNTTILGGVAGTELIVLYEDSGSLNFGSFNSETFLDFETNTYETYFETGYFFAGDLLVKKNAPLVTVYLRSTEDGFTGNDTIGYTPVNPSSLFLKAYWDFKNTPASTQQTYRIKPFIIVDSSDLSNNQQKSSIITTRLKVRGRGRSMRLRFEAEQGKDFVFLGYSILVGINDRF